VIAAKSHPITSITLPEKTQENQYMPARQRSPFVSNWQQLRSLARKESAA
jgi:hypothetical protein